MRRNNLRRKSNLPKSQIEVLALLHDSKDYGIHGKDLVRWRIDFPEIDDTLQILVNKDLVEYVLEEHTYYLAYDGFEALEKAKEVKKPQRKSYPSEIEQWQELMNTIAGPHQLRRNIVIAILFLLAFGSLSYFLS
ncbi:MAG: hypothetical protein AAF573_17940 [Bacteroidota bacterium]